jgi:uncharacterized protein (DUF1778 family)
MKTGRPKLSESQKKDQITGVRLRGDERELLEKAASIQRQSLSNWIRATLLAAAEGQIRQ